MTLTADTTTIEAPPIPATAEAARALVLDLCDVAGDCEAVAALLTPRPGDDPRRAASVALVALHIVFLECLTQPVPTTEQETTA